ncbi:RES family NAD+ phosphorylase [Aquirufa sp. ROCK2-A2]
MPNSILVYRIVESVFAHLQASGKTNRWNFEKNYVLYTAQSKSLATLENLCRLSGFPIKDYICMEIEIDLSNTSIQMLEIEHLHPDWQTLNGMYRCQQLGQSWYQEKKNLILKVPSVIVPDEYNYLINTEHPNFISTVRILKKEPYLWDNQLF